MRKSIVALVACVAVGLVVALPAAARHARTTGERISLYAPPATFTAGAPFHVEHGFSCAKRDRVCRREQIVHGHFDLYVDGVLQHSRVVVDHSGGNMTKLWLTSFRSGLPAGDHTLEGVWTESGAVVQDITATITFG